MRVRPERLKSSNLKSLGISILVSLIASSYMSKYFAASTDGRRLPKYAGTWYESNSDALNQQLTGFLKKAGGEMLDHPFDERFANNQPVTGSILAAIVPHAGYAYS